MFCCGVDVPLMEKEAFIDDGNKKKCGKLLYKQKPDVWCLSAGVWVWARGS